MKKLLKLIVPVAVVAVIAAGAWFGYRMFGKTEARYVFRTEQLSRRDLVRTISASGTVEPEELVNVGAQVTGKIMAFGKDADGSLILADEVLTPDSSRFWPQASYAVGANPPSLDKQYVRDWLDSIHFNHQPPGPVLPDDVVARTREIYVKAYEELSGKKLV